MSNCSTTYRIYFFLISNSFTYFFSFSSLFQHECKWVGSYDIHWHKCCYKVNEIILTNILYYTRIRSDLRNIVFIDAEDLKFWSDIFCLSCSVRVSNELGLLHPKAAKYSVYVAVFQSLFIGLFFMVVILVSRDYFAVIYTDSKVLQQAVAKLAWLLGITMVLNSVQPVISGIELACNFFSLTNACVICKLYSIQHVRVRRMGKLVLSWFLGN